MLSPATGDQCEEEQGGPVISIAVVFQSVQHGIYRVNRI